MNLGYAIKKIRVKKKLTQEILALETGCSKDYIGLIERKMRIPELRTIQKIADTLDIKIGDLLLRSLEPEDFKSQNPDFLTILNIVKNWNDEQALKLIIDQ